jgi:hypothetical protein
LVHITVVPLWTVSVAGEKVKLLIVTLAEAGGKTGLLVAAGAVCVAVCIEDVCVKDGG